MDDSARKLKMRTPLLLAQMMTFAEWQIPSATRERGYRPGPKKNANPAKKRKRKLQRAARRSAR